MSEKREHDIALMESVRAKQEDLFFIARPSISRTAEVERLFRAGFERAWDWWTGQEEKPAANAVEICQRCNGSGEGLYDSSVCDACHGSGEYM